MTLSGFTIVLYFIVLVCGIVFGIFDLLDVKSGLGFLIYAILLAIEALGVKLMSERYQRFYRS